MQKPYKDSYTLNQQSTVFPIVISLLAVIAYLFDDLLMTNFIYQRDLIAQGEVWRLITGHFFHTNINHLILNLAALWLLWALHKGYYRPATYGALFLFSALICSSGLFYFSPQLFRYVGLSGVLHGVFVWGAIEDIKHRDITGYLLFVGVWLKIIYEQLYGANSDISHLIEANVAIDAHLWGAIGGLLFAFLYYQVKALLQKYNSQ
jgi:rhomboid family GlyGly-CTERM serine protease